MAGYAKSLGERGVFDNLADRTRKPLGITVGVRSRDNDPSIPCDLNQRRGIGVDDRSSEVESLDHPDSETLFEAWHNEHGCSLDDDREIRICQVPESAHVAVRQCNFGDDSRQRFVAIGWSDNKQGQLSCTRSSQRADELTDPAVSLESVNGEQVALGKPEAFRPRVGIDRSREFRTYGTSDNANPIAEVANVSELIAHRVGRHHDRVRVLLRTLRHGFVPGGRA